MSTPKIPDSLIAEAQRVWGYFPFMRCWVAVKGTSTDVFCRATARRAQHLVRLGWSVYEMERVAPNPLTSPDKEGAPVA